MGQLTEVEIFDCLRDNFKSAARYCEALARDPRRGRNYLELRKCLKLIEGAARQAATWRSDTRWLRISFMMGEAHKRAGDWLRGPKDPRTGRRTKIADGQLNPLFAELAQNMRKGLVTADRWKNDKTGVIGRPILPRALPGPHRDTRPVGYRRAGSGLLVPEHVA